MVKAMLTALGYYATQTAVVGAEAAVVTVSWPAWVLSVVGTIAVTELVCTDANMREAGFFAQGLKDNAVSGAESAGSFARSVGSTLEVMVGSVASDMRWAGRQVGYFWRGLTGD
jgi:hypothetical protein